jgi:integrase
MELGFGEFVRAANGTHLFPELPKQTKDGPECTAAFSKWLGRYLKEIGIKRPRLAAAHSLRHTFVEACDNCGVNPKVTSALVGHSSGHAGAGSAMTRRYGRSAWLQTRMSEITKVQFEGLPASLRRWGKNGS